ncbi:integral membrane [Lecanosticta acicola]|uniref:Integral membrane n=1 Tax=Lecanosticta acicola TaxID=111012 RepID=A0AAI8Z3U9_9PEZI|nr:integral membrane [Lecanosticta acicola]
MDPNLNDRLAVDPDVLEAYPAWQAKPEWILPSWGEAVMFVTILFGGMILTRRRNYSIFDSNRGLLRSILDKEAPSEQELLDYDSDNDDDRQQIQARDKRLPKTRDCCGLCTVETPNSSRFKNHIHSRVFQKFPFLVEMFYWVLNYLFYRMTTVLSNKIFAGQGIWIVSQDHGLTILEFEEFSWLSFLFPIRERGLQQWFMNGHQDLLTFLDRFYSIVHIPASMGFIVWYYYAAPSHSTFAAVRRTMTLTNFMAFMTFIFFPVMPPRLLPKQYGFLDTVHMEDAASLWQSGKHVNSLAAMPSMHFGYSFAIGCTLLYHSGLSRTRFEKYETRKNTFWKCFYVALGAIYPTMILITIIATANHYFLDALVAFCYCCIAFACNKVFYVLLPFEDLFLWLIRAEKPIPSTGERFHARGGRL